MFYIIGIGLTTKQLSLEAKNAILESKEVYIDNYTNILSFGEIKELKETLGKDIIQLNRTELEQKQEYLKNDSCL